MSQGYPRCLLCIIIAFLQASFVLSLACTHLVYPLLVKTLLGIIHVYCVLVRMSLKEEIFS